MKRFRLIAAIVISLMVIIVVLQNTESVETRILFASIVMPRALLLFITFLCGGIAGLAVALQLWGGRSKGKAKEKKETTTE